jgi:HK97 family phage prohead protease
MAKGGYMPLPEPTKNESKDDFLARCMADEVMLEEYDDEKQRYAICQTQWDNSRSDLPNIERRISAVDDVELRVEGEKEPKLIGYAAKYNKWSDDLGGFRERIAASAFAGVAKDSDVRALKNHDPNLLLGRTASGTLRLTENKRGLKFECDVPNTTTGKDVVEEIRRKDITGCSFAFVVEEDVWGNNKDGTAERTIVKIGELFDVGPVTYPAYPDTAVAVRSLDKFKKQDTEQDEEENKEVDLARQRDIERKYRKAGRIISRNKSA